MDTDGQGGLTVMQTAGAGGTYRLTDDSLKYSSNIGWNKISNSFLFEVMQEEIHEFDRLQVWELVPPPDCAMINALKWVYKVKLDENGDVLKNKACIVAKGYIQEKGIDFEESFALVAKLK
nr:retrovirus-related Pol polyprotein from transposon TNT 1-94 [Tanacetum cinerariifolium]